MSHNGWNCDRCTLWHPENHLQCICGYARWGTQLDTDSDEGISAYVARNNSYAAADPVPSPGNVEETSAEGGESANAGNNIFATYVAAAAYARWGTDSDADSDHGNSANNSRNNSYAAADRYEGTVGLGRGLVVPGYEGDGWGRRPDPYAAADPVPSPGNSEETLAEVGDSANADDDLRCAIMKDYPVEGVRLIRGDGRDSRSVYDFRNLLRHLMVSGSRHDDRFVKIPTTGEWIDIGSALEYVEKVSPEEQQRINAARSDEVCHQGITLDEIISMHHWYK